MTKGGFLVPDELVPELLALAESGQPILSYWIISSKPRKWWQFWKPKRILDIRLSTDKENIR